ncbi:MAG: hypothetical protein U0169_01260 [Polyangiaceae bacterium]
MGRMERTSDQMGQRTVPKTKAMLATALTFAGLCLAAVGGSGCAVSDNDVHRWETTERGPDKLVAVVTHDKYAMPLRVESALSLVRMKPRGGRRIGTELLTSALASVSDETRKKIVGGMAPELVKQMQQPPPKKGDQAVKDESVPFKDAAFALLQHEPSLVSDEKVRTDLAAALTQWASADFENRIENSSQQYGIEQMLRYLGGNSVRGLPALITADSLKIDRIAGLVADLGDAETKTKASDALVNLAKYIESTQWVDKETPVVKQANERAKITATPEQLKGQITKYQDQEITKVFSAMKRVGGRPVVNYVLGYGADKAHSEERRKAALAAAEGRIDPTDVEKIFDIAKNDETPDGVRDLAFARLGELKKELILPKLYSLFDNKKWKIRWVAGSLALKTLTTKSVPDFMGRLPASPAVKMGMSEPITYAANMMKMEAPAGEPKPKDAILPFLESKALGPKLTAIAYFYGGKKSDIPIIAKYGNDGTPVSKCDQADECGWTCDVPKPGTQDREAKTITTVGEFVKFCVEPSMEGQ